MRPPGTGVLPGSITCSAGYWIFNLGRRSTQIKNGKERGERRRSFTSEDLRYSSQRVTREGWLSCI